jgi:hypothetical protein
VNFRQLVRYLGPRWLTRDRVLGTETTSRVLYSVALLTDSLSERVVQGVRARFPGLGPDDALSELGRDRLIWRGPAEPATTYAGRLTRWLDDHRVRGNPWALLEQIRAYLVPHAVRVRTVDQWGNWYTIEADGTRSRYKASAWDWDGTSQAAGRSRFWVLIYLGDTGPWFRQEPWGDPGKLWGEAGQTWGSTATPEEIAGLRRIVDFWRPAGTRCVQIIYCFEPTLFAPSDTAPPLPDGTYATWGKYVGSVKVHARNRDAIYIRGTDSP